MSKRQCISCGSDYGDDHLKGCVRYVLPATPYMDLYDKHQIAKAEIDRLTKEVERLKREVDSRERLILENELQREENERLVSGLSASEFREKLCLGAWNDCKAEIDRLTKELKEAEEVINNLTTKFYDLETLVDNATKLNLSEE